MPEVNAAPSITITGIGDHHRKEWPITFTGIRKVRQEKLVMPSG
jgi:hypothetical protein